MADPSKLPKEELKHTRDLGAVMYLGAYVHLMTRELGVDGSNAVMADGVNQMILRMVEPMNIATETIWRALMNDSDGIEAALARFRSSLDNL